MKKISMIVPIYKSQVYLRRCIDSILNQSYKNIELILIDDGSPDNCGEICDEYAKHDSRIKVIHKDNEGVSTARNTGIQYATGEYLMFVDSDDWIEATMVYNLINLMNINNADIVLSGVLIKTFLNNVSPIIDIYAMKEKKYNVKSLLEGINEEFDLVCFCGPCGKLYKTNIIKDNNIQFNRNIFLGEDTLFVLDYLKYSIEIFATKHVYYNYFRENEESLFSSYNHLIFEFREIVFNEILNTMTLFNCSKQSKFKFEAIYFSVLFNCLTLDFINFSKSKKTHKMKNIEKFINNQEIRKYVYNKKSIDIKNIILFLLVKLKAKKLLYIILKVKFVYI